MVINAGSGAAGTINASIQINTNGQEISGWTTQGSFCGSLDIHIVFRCSLRPCLCHIRRVERGTLTANGTNATGAQTGVYLSFNLPGGGVVLARTAVSYVSVTNAQANLQAESPASSFTSAGFDAMAGAASNSWNGYLNKIQVSGGTPADTADLLHDDVSCPPGAQRGQRRQRRVHWLHGQTHTASGYAKDQFFSGWIFTVTSASSCP